MRLYGALVAAILVAAAWAGPSFAGPARTPDLLIVGTPHLANPNRDAVNGRVPDITSPQRQRELEALVDALARYRPTRIAVEVQAKEQARLDERYQAYRTGAAASGPGEVEQIAFRLAAKLNMPRVDAVDWNGMPPMAEADFDYEAWAKANGRGEELRALLGRFGAKVEARDAQMACAPVGDWYREVNSPAYRAEDNQIYFDIVMLGEAGPNWVGGSWYMRNLRIFAALKRLAQPGDRMLVLFGAGHGFQLDQYARQSGAFTVSDTMAYLPQGRRPKAPC